MMCTIVNYNDDLDATSRTILANLRVKNRVQGETQLIGTFKTEEDRLEALEREFGIKLSQEEIDGINGRNLSVAKLDLDAPTFGF